MPTYSYKCKKCSHEFDAMQSIKAEPFKNCREAGISCSENEPGEVLRKISGSVGLVFNGKGFYITDYTKKGSEGCSAASDCSNCA